MPSCLRLLEIIFLIVPSSNSLVPLGDNKLYILLVFLSFIEKLRIFLSLSVFFFFLFFPL